MKLKWAEEPWAIIDTETTGVDPETARIWEVGLMLTCSGANTRVASRMFNPGCEIPKEVVDICHLTEQDLSDIRGAPAFDAERALRLADHLGNRLVVGYNILSYDWPLLLEEEKRVGTDALANVPILGFVDVLVLVRSLRRGLRSKKLADVANALDVQSNGAHRAMADVHMTREILKALAPELPGDLDELLELQAQWKGRQDADFERYSYWLSTGDDGRLMMACGAHCGVRLDQVDPAYLAFMLRKQHSWDVPLPPAVDEAFRNARRDPRSDPGFEGGKR